MVSRWRPSRTGPTTTFTEDSREETETHINFSNNPIRVKEQFTTFGGTVIESTNW